MLKRILTIAIVSSAGLFAGLLFADTGEIAGRTVSAGDTDKTIFAGQDLHLSAYKMTVCTTCPNDEKTVIFEDGFLDVGKKQLLSILNLMPNGPKRLVKRKRLSQEPTQTRH